MLAGLVVVSAVVPAVDRAGAEEAKAAKGAVEKKPTGRVPQHFAKLDLTSDQKTRIYAIQDEFEGRIDALLAEIEELRVQRDSQIESVLSAGQREELKKIVEQAKVDRIQRSRETEAAKKAYEAAKKKGEKK
jgi:Spy/CpxP family protein refolding chaperone